MSYTIHIERYAPSGEREAIALPDWIAAVKATDGVRLRTSDLTATNPQTGQIITISNTGGDADAFFPDENDWLPTFFWSPAGRISFDPGDDFERADSPLARAARRLAETLAARLIGDEGEFYN